MFAHAKALTDALGVEAPLIQAPMAGANDVLMALAVAKAGGLGLGLITRS